jgi:hypothetical protein
MLYIPLLLLMGLLTSCTEKQSFQDVVLECDGEQTRITLRTENNINYLESFVQDSLTDSWRLPYPVFKLAKGDINNDGQEDIAVGVIKSTRRDSVVRKRLFFYQVRNRSIIPLWLGSSLSHPLEDFRIRKQDSTTFVKSVEIENSGRFLVAEYEWFGFGLTFRKYLHRELPYDNALKLLDQ